MEDVKVSTRSFTRLGSINYLKYLQTPSSNKTSPRCRCMLVKFKIANYKLPVLNWRYFNFKSLYLICLALNRYYLACCFFQLSVPNIWHEFQKKKNSPPLECQCLRHSVACLPSSLFYFHLTLLLLLLLVTSHAESSVDFKLDYFTLRPFIGSQVVLI